MRATIYILPVLWCLLVGYLITTDIPIPSVYHIAMGILCVVMLMALMWREIRDTERFGVYDALDIFLDYNANQSDDELYAHTEWITNHPEFVNKYHRQFVVLSLPEYNVMHSCVSADEFIRYLDSIPAETRDKVFVYHADLFIPKYWSA